MKKRLLALSLVVALSVAFSACGKKEKLSVKESVVKLDAGKTYTIEIEKGDAENIKWSSDDTNVATVSADGVITGKHGGVTVVEGRTDNGFVHVGVIVEQDNDGYVDKDGNIVKVYNEFSNITSIVVGVKGGSKSDITIKQGEKYSLVAYTEPESSDKIDWKSEDKNIVTVDEKGSITAVGKGLTKVLAYAPNGVKGEMTVRVK